MAHWQDTERPSVVLASGNRHKLLEISRLTERSAASFRLVTFDDLGIAMPDIDENGETYEENALIKARTCSSATGLPALADDSGLEVLALRGAPGVRSARIVPGSDADRVQWLLSALRGETDRRACFVACVVIAFPGEFGLERDFFSFQGRVDGVITAMPSGEGGFGYDPVFIPEKSHLTFAELSGDEKDRISHRGIALEGVAQSMPSVLKYMALRRRFAGKE